MSEDDAIFELQSECRQEIYGRIDIENNHQRADQIVCRFLRANGYATLAEEYENIEKWYS